MATPVRIEQLPPMRVASVCAYGTEPEFEALTRLLAWARPKGFLTDPARHRIFGFNNPDPNPGSPNHGYEFWMQVGLEIQSEEGIEVKEFLGGRYAVRHCEVKRKPWETIPQAWEEHMRWLQSSPYRIGSHQWLEEYFLGPTGAPDDFDLDLFLPLSA